MVVFDNLELRSYEWKTQLPHRHPPPLTLPRTRRTGDRVSQDDHVAGAPRAAAVDGSRRGERY